MARTKQTGRVGKTYHLAAVDSETKIQIVVNSTSDLHFVDEFMKEYSPVGRNDEVIAHKLFDKLRAAINGKLVSVGVAQAPDQWAEVLEEYD